MDALNTQDDLSDLALKKINFGEDLITSIKEIKNVEGSQKLCRKINQEIKFLKKVLKDNLLKKEHLQCSNLTHFSALVSVLKTMKNCQSVCKVFMLHNRKITVDIISDGGLTWTKVIARNPKSLNQICLGDTSYGVRSITDQAEEYVECAKLHPCLFQTPKIIFFFANGISSKIATKLELHGIIVKGTRLDYSDDDEDNLSEDEVTKIPTKVPSVTDLSTKNVSTLTKANLDVSAMLAYCSSVTNGGAFMYDFDVSVLKQQAEWERLRPQKPILDKFFEGKTLYCCQTARDSFIEIVNTVGGPNEKIRAQELLKRIIVLPDDADSKSTIKNDDCDRIFDKVQFMKDKLLKVGGQIKQRSLIIFTFGDQIRAITVTANDGFVRAAKQQGINFVVFVHESRPLTEQKEKSKAIPLTK